MYNIGDRFEIEVSNILNGDEYVFDSLRIILSEDELNRLKRVINEDDKPDMVRTLYNCFIIFMNTDWKDRHLILGDDESDDVADMLAKCGDPYDFIDKVSSYFQDIHPGDIVKHKSFGDTKYLVIGENGKDTVFVIKLNNSTLMSYTLSKHNLRKVRSNPAIYESIIKELNKE